MVSRLLGVDVVVAVERAHHGGATQGLALVDEPVGGLLGVVEELHDKVLVGAAGALGDPVLLRVHLVHDDVLGLHVARVDGAEAAAAPIEATRFLDDGHLAALLGRSGRAGAAGKPGADDEDVGVHRGGDVRDGLGRDLPLVGRGARSGHGGAAGGSGRGGIALGRRGAAGQSGHGGSCGGGGAQAEEGAARQTLGIDVGHRISLSSQREALRLASVLRGTPIGNGCVFPSRHCPPVL